MLALMWATDSPSLQLALKKKKRSDNVKFMRTGLLVILGTVNSVNRSSRAGETLVTC